MIRNFLRRLCKDDRGNTGVAMVVAAPALMAMMLMLVSAQQYWDANRQAQAIAAETARIGAQPNPALIRTEGLDAGVWSMTPEAETEAREYVARHEGATVVQIAEGAGPLTVDAEVEVEVEYIFDVGLPDVGRGFSTAVVLRGVEDGI